MSWTELSTFVTGNLLTAAQLNALKARDEYLLSPNVDVVTPTANTSATSATWGAVGAAWELTLTTHGGFVLLGMTGVVFTGASTVAYLDVYIEVDGDADYRFSGADNGLVNSQTPGEEEFLSFTILIEGLPAGTHVFKLYWRGSTANGQNLRGTTDKSIGCFWAKEG